MKKQKTKINVNPVEATSSRPHFEEKTQNNKGITLIALIVTIIVMLILVGVTVNVALNGGLFDIAKQATSGMTMAQIQERAEVVKYTLMADAQTDNTIRLSKQEYRDRLLQEFEGSTADGYKVIVDERYVINIQNIDLDISVTDLNQQGNTSAFNLRELTTLSYTTSNIEKDGKKYITNVDLTLTKAAFTRAEYIEYKLAENSALEERTQEEKNKIALEYAAGTWYGTEEEFETLDEGVIYAINDYYGTTYTTTEECLADENVQAEWGKTIGQLYYNFYYYEIVNTVPELTEQETLDLLYQEAYEEELNVIGREYTVEYNKYAAGLKLYVSKDGGEEKLVTTAAISIVNVDRTVNYQITENGTYEFVLRTRTINGVAEEILREKIEVRDMATDKNPYYVTAEDAEGLWTTDGEGTITGYLGTDTDVTIPIRIGEESITKIGDDAFESNTNLVNVNIMNNIRSIGKRTFNACTNLTNITIPNTVTSIGEAAFHKCIKLTSITIPESITSINDSTFAECDSLTRIIIPDKVTKIGVQAFFNCDNLKEIILSANLISIKYGAFSYCDSLTNITIPDSVTTLGTHAFRGCTSLTSITIPDSVTTLSDYVFDGCTSLASITIPDSVTTLGTHAFSGCTSLTSITIPDSVTTLGSYAFDDCANLVDVSLPSNLNLINSGLFYGCTNLTTVTIPDSVTIIKNHAFYNCINLTDITIPDSVTTLEHYAFGNCASLKNVTISEGVTLIWWKTFTNCTSLTSITIPNSVTKFEPNISSSYDIFDGCTNLTTINFAPGSNPIPNEDYAPWGAPNENVKVTKLTQTTSEE